MKLNGRDNIITDYDVTVTGPKHIGDSLHTVIEEIDGKVQSLEEQTKWIYANGGVGTGGGGGGGSTKWQIKATLDNVELTTGGTISLSKGVGNYDLKIYTSGGSGTYSVTYTYGNNISRTVALSADNGWSTSVSLNISENGRISISASDGVIRREITGCQYIVIPYIYNPLVLYRDDGGQYPSGNSDIFVDDAHENGINIRSTYAIAVEGEFNYRWLFDGVVVQDWTEIPSTSGYLEYVVPKSFLVDENAALHSYQLQTSSKPTGVLEPVITTLAGSFNLIPNGLYLKISPNQGETIYDNPNVEDPFVFSTNKAIGLFVRIYNGPNASGQMGSISWQVVYHDGTLGPSDNKDVTDGITYAITVSFAKPGWSHVIFNYNIGGNRGEPVTKYFYCDESSTNYNWFVDGHAPKNRRWYIAQANSEETKVSGISGINTVNVPLYLQKKSSDLTATELTIDTYTNNDQLINIGIQYNDINDTSEPIIKLYSDVAKTQNAITIYQNKVVFGSRFFQSDADCNIFLAKELNYNPDDRDKYHMITINAASCYYDTLTNNTYYEIAVYIDGSLEGAVKSKSTVSPELYKIDLLPGNYSVNHIDIAQFDANDGNRIMYDSDINWYWNSYKERIQHPVSEAETEILASLFDPNNNNAPTYSIENNLIKVNSAFPNNVALNCSANVLVVDCPRDIIYNNVPYTIYQWMNTRYVDGEQSLNQAKIDVQKVQWSKGNSELKEIAFPRNADFGQNTHFYLKIQGSSTQSNKDKNYTFGVVQDSTITEQGQTVIFSPNYVKGDASTFLPEQAFTLKADHVDSSHSNNTSVGKFVNENNTWDYKAMQNQVADPEITSHVKQCLEGFSMLMFMNVTYREDNIDYIDTYYLGVYNFNLGRDSYFNLGYCDLGQLDPDELTERTDNGFVYYKVGGENTSGITPKEGFLAAEIQDNSPYWDFSQYDESVLFPINPSETSGFMFGDIVDSPMSRPYTESTIKNFVHSVAKAGGYLFEYIGKDLVPCSNLEDNKQVTYHIPNKVSDCRTQYVRTRVEGNNVFTPYTGDIHELNEGALTDCILDDLEQEKVAKLDYDSIVYYYTTCMVLGLVDSVQKNLNVKTWSAADQGYNTKMGAFFYDMDTCLGKTNAGGKTSYFAFSDFWKSRITRYDEHGDIIPDGDTTTPVARVTNDGIDNYRDCFLWNSTVTGYDTPSSYLFAIAKYAILSETIKSAGYSEMFPQNIYAGWRRANGILETADSFIDRYFASNLSNIPDCLINLNYRNKYLYDYKEHELEFVASESLHGRGIEETRDWLRGRLHILDAYFNLRKANVTIYNNILEEKPIIEVSGNQDVYILRDIFSANDETIGRKSPLTFTVNAADYSPLCVRLGSDYKWYLFEDSDINYETTVPVTGVLQTTFGGSQLWRSLDSINSFIVSRDQTGNNFIFNTNTIDRLVGNEGIQSGDWNINAPALKTIQLTSPNYSGTLRIGSTFESLNDINISNSAISLIMDGAHIKELNASNLRNSGTIDIKNCSSLTTVNLNNSLINTCVISPTWTNTLNFSNVRARQLTLKSPTEDGSLTINENSAINSLSFTNMKTVNIYKCNSLQSVSCIDTTSNILEDISVTDCNALQSFTIKSSRLKTLKLNGCGNLQEITIQGSDFSTLRILDLQGVPLKKITFKDDAGNIIDTQTDGRFNFSRFTNLSNSSNASTAYVRMGNNENLKSVQFYYPNTTYLHYNFQGCSSLERIYGQFSIKCTACFYQCYLFSIHGSNLTGATWNGGSILAADGRIKHPTELYSGDVRLHPINAQGLTKMWLGIADGGSLLSRTNSTIFDLYYILDMCDKEVNVTSINYLFYDTRNSDFGRFNWTDECDNSPHVKMFEHCTHLISMYYTISGSGIIRLWSPSHSGSNVTSDNGLFSPLVNLKTFRWLFNGYSYVIDRFCFRRTVNLENPNDYKITEFGDFKVYSVVGDVNNISRNNITTYDSGLGNLTGFFTNLPSIAGTIRGIFNGTHFIRFNTISNIPNGINTILASFNTSYGTGEINFSTMFNSGTTLTSMFHSFRVGSILSGVDSTYMNLTNTTFSRFVPRSGYSGLVNIGYDRTLDANYYATGPLDSCLSGAIKKYLPNEGFPYNIFRQLVNLKMAAGVFRNAEAQSTQFYNDLKLPGNLFERNTKLENCAAEFYNLQVDYQISEPYKIIYTTDSYNIDTSDQTKYPNFIYCPNIKNVSYLFGSSKTDDVPHLTGIIPKNLFWHGATVTTNTIYGANERIFDEQTGEYEYVELSDTVTTITPTKGISDVKECFTHCNCDPYNHETTSELGYDYEYNPDYSPFVWNKIEGEFYTNNKRDTRRYTIEWSYDGRHGFETFNTPDYRNEDFVDWSARLSDLSQKYEYDASHWTEFNDIIPSKYDRFICAPDLLRYCDSNCDVSYLFAGSGVAGMNSHYQISNPELNENKYAFGIKGRICPYLLKPVSTTTNVNGMFQYCKCLTYILDRETNKAYMIPDKFFTYAPAVKYLQRFFERTVLPNEISLSEVFKPLKNHDIDVQYIFSLCFWNGTNTALNTNISEVFAQNLISSLVRAFDGNSSIDTSSSYPYNQYVTFSNIFIQNKYNTTAYQGNVNFSYCFYGWSRANFDNEHSLSTRTEDYNYTRTQ